MKAITLWQPWASLVAVEAKPYETRSFYPPDKLVGTRIAIHAAKKPVTPILRDLPNGVVLDMRDAFKKAGIHEFRMNFDDAFNSLPRGVVVCTAIIVGYRRAQHMAIDDDPDPWMSDSFGDYTPGRYIWKLVKVRQLQNPLPWKGRQGWFDVPSELIESAGVVR